MGGGKVMAVPRAWWWMGLWAMGALHAQVQAAAPCDQPAFRQFDFWVGDWEVRDPRDRVVGHNVITAEQDGCVLVERWRSVTGNTGISINYYEPRSARWKQTWISPSLILEMTGDFRDGVLTLQGPMQYIGTNQTTWLRGVWTPLPDGRVRQHFVESRDEGKTWQEWFDGYYVRRKPEGT